MQRLAGLWASLGLSRLKRGRNGTNSNQPGAKRPRAATSQKLPNNVLRHIYTKANPLTQARLRVATKAVVEMPAPKATESLVRRRLAQLHKKLETTLTKLIFAGVYSTPDWFDDLRDLVHSVHIAYAHKPATAAAEAGHAWQVVFSKPNPALQNLARANANMTNADRRKALGPHVLELVRGATQKLKQSNLRQRINRSLQQLGNTHKNLNARASRSAAQTRNQRRDFRHRDFTYGNGNVMNNNLANATVQVQLRRNARRTARIQRRAQRREQRSQARNSQNWGPPTVAATPPPWMTLRGNGRARTVANKARASAAHPAVAGWNR